MLLAAAVIAAAAIGYLYTRLARIQPARFAQAEAVVRETGKAAATLARLVAAAADLLRSLNPPPPALASDYDTDPEGDFLD